MALRWSKEYNRYVPLRLPKGPAGDSSTDEPKKRATVSPAQVHAARSLIKMHEARGDRSSDTIRKVAAVRLKTDTIEDVREWDYERGWRPKGFTDDEIWEDD